MHMCVGADHSAPHNQRCGPELCSFRGFLGRLHGSGELTGHLLRIGVLEGKFHRYQVLS